MEEQGLWGKIDPSRWREISATTGRCATEVDVKEGRAVFFIRGSAEPVSMDLPRAALQHLENGSSQYVVAIQAERTDSGVTFGVRPLAGGNCVCLEQELEFLSDFSQGEVTP